MIYSREALAALDALGDETKEAASVIQKKMHHGLDAAACASRQFLADRTASGLCSSFVTAMGELCELGSAGDCISADELNDIETTIRQLFEDARHKAWERTKEDARPYNLVAAE